MPTPENVVDLSSYDRTLLGSQFGVGIKDGQFDILVEDDGTWFYFKSGPGFSVSTGWLPELAGLLAEAILLVNKR